MPHVAEEILAYSGLLRAPGREQDETEDDGGSGPRLSPQGPAAPRPVQNDHPKHSETPVANPVSVKQTLSMVKLRASTY
jgi:hypothetical protein